LLTRAIISQGAIEYFRSRIFGVPRRMCDVAERSVGLGTQPRDREQATSLKYNKVYFKQLKGVE